MANQYDVGDIARLTGTFTSTAGAAANPTKVVFWVSAPSSTVLVESSTGATVTNPAVGTFNLDVSVNSSGLWMYRIYSTGSLEAAQEGTFVGRRRLIASTGT